MPKFFNLFSVILILTLLSGCGKNENTSGKSGAISESFESSLRLNYEFSEAGGEWSAECTTGNHSFTSLAEMCMYLQNDEFNQDCADDARMDLFNEKCPAESFGDFQTSFACTLTLTRPETAGRTFQPLRPEDIIDQTRFCSGYTPAGQPTGNIPARSLLWQNMQLEIEMQNDNEATHFSLSAYRPNAERTDATLLFPRFTTERGPDGGVVGGDSGGRQYNISCRFVWACE